MRPPHLRSNIGTCVLSAKHFWGSASPYFALAESSKLSGLMIARIRAHLIITLAIERPTAPP
jgi:hypothetical protein